MLVRKQDCIPQIKRPQLILKFYKDKFTDCSECPDEDDCCCGIELQDTDMGQASLRICGTTDGTGSCSDSSAPSPCISISGGGQAISLSPQDPKFGFCMLPGNSFYIQNMDLNNPADITITCQDDVVFAQTLTISIPANTRWYFDTDGGCVTVRCM